MSDDKLRYSLEELFSDFAPPTPEGEVEPLPPFPPPAPEAEPLPSPPPPMKEFPPTSETKPLPPLVPPIEELPPAAETQPLPPFVPPLEELPPASETRPLPPFVPPIEKLPPASETRPLPPFVPPIEELPPASETQPLPRFVPLVEELPPAPDVEPLPPAQVLIPDDLQTWRQQLIRHILQAVALIGVLVIVAGSYSAYTSGQLWLIPLYVGAYAILSLVTFWRRAPYIVQVSVLLSLIFGMAVLALFTSGRYGDGRIFLLALPLVAVLFLSPRGGIITLGISVLTLAVFTWAFYTGRIAVPPSQPANLVAWVSVSGMFLAVSLLLLASQNYLTPRLANALAQSRNLAQELETHHAMLEERSQSLEEANVTLRRQAMQLETSVEVGRTITSIFETDRLMRKTVALLRERFGLYHVGIFLVEATGEWVVLHEATGEAGAQMVAHGHRLRIGESSPVGWTALHRAPRIKLDVGEDEIHFDHVAAGADAPQGHRPLRDDAPRRRNSLLPHIRSEMALPMMVGERLLGVLDLQSTDEAAFDENNTRVFQGMADQIAIAIENARRLSKETTRLEATSPIYRVSRRLTTATTTGEVADAIVDSLAETGADGCLVVEFELSPAGDPVAMLYLSVWRKERLPEFQPGLRIPFANSPFPIELVSRFWTVTDVTQDEYLPPSARQVFETTNVNALVNIPLRVGEKVIGQVVVLRETPGPFSDGALRLYEVLSDQAAMALERTRLLEEAQRRAAWEQLTRQIIDRTRRATDIEQVLQTTAEELSQALEVGHVSIELDIGAGDGRKSGF